MIREFIFDSAGNIVGYRCLASIHQDKKHDDSGEFWHIQPCGRLFLTPRGIWQHWRLAHGIYQQLNLIPLQPRDKK